MLRRTARSALGHSILSPRALRILQVYFSRRLCVGLLLKAPQESDFETPMAGPGLLFKAPLLAQVYFSRHLCWPGLLPKSPLFRPRSSSKGAFAQVYFSRRLCAGLLLKAPLCRSTFQGAKTSNKLGICNSLEGPSGFVRPRRITGGFWVLGTSAMPPCIWRFRVSGEPKGIRGYDGSPGCKGGSEMGFICCANVRVCVRCYVISTIQYSLKLFCSIA